MISRSIIEIANQGDQIWAESGSVCIPNGTNPGLFQIRIQYILARFISNSGVAHVAGRSRAILIARRHRSEVNMSPWWTPTIIQLLGFRVRSFKVKFTLC